MIDNAIIILNDKSIKSNQHYRLREVELRHAKKFEIRGRRNEKRELSSYQDGIVSSLFPSQAKANPMGLKAKNHAARLGGLERRKSIYSTSQPEFVSAVVL
jgi:hypothetical protein